MTNPNGMNGRKVGSDPSNALWITDYRPAKITLAAVSGLPDGKLYQMVPVDLTPEPEPPRLKRGSKRAY